MQSTAAPTQAVAEQLHALWGLVMRRSGGDFLAELDQHGVSLSQLKALHALQNHDELSVKQVGEQLGLSLPAASRSVDGLVQRGLVDRFECAADRRSRLVRISPAGAELLDRVARARFAGIEEFVATLSPAERDGLAKALLPILERTSP
jgi:DNA-binding MarR family transcriptional regulator